MSESKINLEICGKAYREDQALLAPTLDILKGYHESFNACLQISAKHFQTDEVPEISPELGIVSARTGSLEIQTVVDMAPALAMFLPDVINYSIELYKNASELIQLATSFFNHHKRAVNLNISDSPGALTLVNVGDGQITVSRDVLDAALVMHKPLDRIANQVVADQADSIRIHSDREDEVLRINNDNKYSFKLPSANITESAPVNIRCGLYLFNKKSGNGRLDILEEGVEGNYSFSMEDGNVDDFIEALRATYSEIVTTREMFVNALGETKVKRFHIHEIVNHFE